MSDGTISLAIPPQPTGMRMLAGKRVLVTAAAGTGIGSSVARRALEEGATLVISDAHERRLGETLAILAPLGEVHALRCDVTQQADIDALWAFATEKLGGVDVLVNNAGLGGTAPLAEMTDEQWSRVLDVSLTGTFRMMRAAMQQMRNGTIVNNASVLGWRAQAGQAHYAAAKAGVMALTRCAAVEGLPSTSASTRSRRASRCMPTWLASPRRSCSGSSSRPRCRVAPQSRGRWPMSSSSSPATSPPT